MHSHDDQALRLTTTTGAPVADDQNSLSAGDRGPILVQDWQLIEKLTIRTGNVFLSGWSMPRAGARTGSSG